MTGGLGHPESLLRHRLVKQGVREVDATAIMAEAVSDGRIDVEAIAMLADFQTARREAGEVLIHSLRSHQSIIEQWLAGPLPRGQRHRLDVLRDRYKAVRVSDDPARMEQAAARVGMAWLALIAMEGVQ